MSNQIAYIVDIDGASFNQALASSHRASPEALALFGDTGSLWDGRFSGRSLDFLVQLSGVVTVVWLSAAYSRFECDAVVRQSVLAWEHELRLRFPGAQAIRVSEFTLDAWVADHDDLWFRDRAAAASLLVWLSTQPSESWAKFWP